MIIRIKKKTLEEGILSVFGLLIIISILIGVSFTTNYVAGATNITNKSVIAKVNVTNTEPNITAIRIDDSTPSPPNEIDLTANGITVVTCNATVFDYNGFEDITGKNTTNATFFINSVGSNAQDDNNSHYTNSSCNRCRQATAAEAAPNDPTNERTAICDCKFAVQYYANASNTWTCEFTVQDRGGTQVSGLEINLTDTDSNSSGVTITQLLAISSPGILDYGNLSVTQTSAEIVHNVTNVGNIPLNLSLRGFGGINDSIDHPGHNLTMICDYGNISIGQQRYSLVSGLSDFNDMRILQNTTEILTGLTGPAAVNITWPQRVDDSHVGNSRNSTYWKIEVPLSVGGLCNGTIIFGAIDAS
jgi:hypothetical protein